MNPEHVKTMLTDMIPFIRTVGLKLDDVGQGVAIATLPSRVQVQNHLGTAHAGAVYTLGESASGGVVLSLFADLLPGVFIALKSATVSHLMATPGDVKAHARLDGIPRVVRESYEADGRVDFDVVVDMSVGEVATARVVYTWAVRAPRS